MIIVVEEAKAWVLLNKDGINGTRAWSSLSSDKSVGGGDIGVEVSYEAASCLDQAVNLFCEIGRLNMAARYFKEIAGLYELEQNIEQAIVCYEKAAELFQNEEVTTTANQCKQKVVQ
ncbi:hypothetical protein K1719_005678 [Acacia pycnantha]|nr:hypothetical protein K1719_005678 [Acacia pycnantha]